MSVAAARWIVPVAVTALAVGGGVAASASTDATPDLPERSAADLLVDIAEAEPTPFSGSVRTVADLGLPALGDLTGGADTGSSEPMSVLTGLLSGETELRVWAGGPEQQRVSVVDDFSELDVIRDGDVAWTYSSSENTATRYDLAEIASRAEAAAAAAPDRERPELPEAPITDLTPDELARELLAEADDTSDVAVGDTQVVAGRDAYTLNVTPRDDATLVGTISVAIDAETGLVLQVEVGARDQSAPAYTSGFSSLDLGAPDADVFAYTPAPGTTVVDAVEEFDAAKADNDASGTPDSGDTGWRDEMPEGVEGPEPVVHGEGWSTVVEFELPADALGAAAAGATPEQDSGSAASDDAPSDDASSEDEFSFGDQGGDADLDPMALLEQFTTEVEGGRVLTSALATVLLTDDGRVFVGAVDAATLQSYAG